MKRAYLYLFLLVILIACDARSKHKKAADEIAVKMTGTKGLNVGKQNYHLYIPDGWTTEHRSAYGIDYYFLFAPKTIEDPNTSINVMTEFMQNLSLEDYRIKAIQSVKGAIPSASNFAQGELNANGLKCAWYSYTMEPQGIRAALVSYIFQKNGIAYQLTAGTAIKDAARYRSLFDSVARSFKFIELEPIKVKPYGN